MVITNKLKKLEQVNNLMEKRGYVLLMPDGCETLEDIANNFGFSEYDIFHWGDLTYTKHYGKHAQHCLFVRLGINITKKKSNISELGFKSNVEISSARFHIVDDLYLIGKDYLKDREHIDSVWKYKLDAEKDADNCNKALNKISATILD